MSTTKTYDYIIVGGGTAGLVLANRLTENATRTVAVVEAGDDAGSDPRIAVPALFSAAIGSELDWGFSTVPQKGLDGRIIGQAQGKLFGGSSAINAEALIPFSSSDLRSWEKIGNQGWDWTTLSPYLQIAFRLALPDAETAQHLNTSWAEGFAGKSDGLVNASFTDAKENPIGKAWIDTFENLGHPLTEDPFSGNSSGAYSAPSTVDATSKTRSHAGTAYLGPVKDRPNLTLYPNSIVRKILIDEVINDDGEPRASGVEFFTNGGIVTILRATREVIVSAGVFNSPKLLELSGIGDPEILRSNGVEVKVANSYVGTNLQDHVLSGMSFEAEDGVFTGDDLLRNDPAMIKWAMDMYQEHKAGPFVTSGITSFAYLPTIDFVKDTKARDALIQSIIESQDAEHPLDLARKNHLRELIENGTEGTAQYSLFPAQSTTAGYDTTTGLGSNTQAGNFLTLVAALSHPLSTGTVHINSPDPTVAPTIDHKYLSSSIDVELHARHVRLLETLASSPPLSGLLKPNGKRNHETACIQGDLEKAKRFAQVASTTNWHSCGTCAMAPKDKGGVVNERLRVHGVKGLRVVDASIFPFIPQSNLQSLVYVIAERAADIIKEDWEVSK